MLKPEQWVKGMMFIKDGETEPAWVLGPGGSRTTYGNVRRGLKAGHEPYGFMDNLEGTVRHFMGCGIRPATYADLGREPVEGERAVRVASSDGGTGPSIGMIYECREGKYGLKLYRDGPPTVFEHLEATDCFAPLLPPTEPAEPRHDFRCSVCNHEWSGHPLCPHGPHDEDAPPARCIAHAPIGYPCFADYFNDPRSCDPCQPCATLIDCADYWCGWYAERKGRCRVCGFLSACYCEGREG